MTRPLTFPPPGANILYRQPQPTIGLTERLTRIRHSEKQGYEKLNDLVQLAHSHQDPHDFNEIAITIVQRLYDVNLDSRIRELVKIVENVVHRHNFKTLLELIPTEPVMWIGQSLDTMATVSFLDLLKAMDRNPNLPEEFRAAVQNHMSRLDGYLRANDY
jgi:hypothetical protein